MSRLNNDDRAGLYITVIFHLVVIVVLLGVQVGFQLTKENAFVMDFSKQEAVEKVQKENDFKEDISEKIAQMLAESEAGGYYRNIAVDRGTLKDDRGTNADELYKDAAKLQQDLSNGIQQDPNDYADIAPAPNQKKKTEDSSEPKYSGPSVISYDLGGRKASHLPIPAYRCMGAGMVTVIITVDNAGTVVSAKVQDEMSSVDQCLRSYAIRAARLSRFSSDPKSSSKQIGNIVYQFIAQ